MRSDVTYSGGKGVSVIERGCCMQIAPLSRTAWVAYNRSIYKYNDTFSPSLNLILNPLNKFPSWAAWHNINIVLIYIPAMSMQTFSTDALNIYIYIYIYILCLKILNFVQLYRYDTEIYNTSVRMSFL